jgi:elongator complex protein 3
VDIRAREIKQVVFDRDKLCLRATEYATGIGQECFLELVTPDDLVVAFLRLSLPKQPSFVAEIAESAMIRELHVYGAAQWIGAHHAARPQHQGLGRWLIDEAAARARQAGFFDLAVISAVGTRPYYRERGFSDGALYQHRRLDAEAHVATPTVS